MNKKYTFTELCELYNKIEIPIIQRDYAQGRNTSDVQIIRRRFVDDFLIPAIVEERQIELDFVYGSILSELKDEIKLRTFIPLDGQQRLTTLFLLYLVVALKEKRLKEIKDLLSKFTYETRPSAHDFCSKLLELNEINDISRIKFEIEDAVWFNEEWNGDPTISGMLNMLDSIASNELLVNSGTGLLDKLLNKELKLISFYFIDLEQFGLTENLYIRMNARGKMLTNFENFKSEFFKTIRYSPILLEEVKNKIEYEWVENLWDYRKAGSYIVDNPFMNYLSFITEMLYYKEAPYRAVSYESNFLSFKILKDIYSVEDNLRFLIFSLDQVKVLKQKKFALLWENSSSLADLLKDVVSGKKDIIQSIILFSTLQYCHEEKPEQHLQDFVRVVRNLIVNTEDNSRREWSRLISSIKNLISDENVYHVLSKLSDEHKLIGFNVNQRKEEIFKANLILKFPNFKKLLSSIEDNNNFRGNITNILIAPFADTENEFPIEKLNTLIYENAQLQLLEKIFVAYKEISKNNFNIIWGNMLTTKLYKLTYESRLVYSGNFKKHPSILIFAKRYADYGKSLDDYLISIQKDFINHLTDNYDNFSSIRNIPEQLYLYYIIHERICDGTYDGFFKNNNFNFGWLARETGYKSLYLAGIDEGSYFSDKNPIFQLYNSQFRYNSGINENNTLDIEIIGRVKERNPFRLIQEWANK